LAAITPDPIDLGAAIARVASPRFGAQLVFIGTTRDTFEGREVLRLEYEAWPELATRELDAIEAEVAARWPGTAAFIVHRTGVVPSGEASVVIAVGSAHRNAAYAASRYAIEALKARAPIWKKEIYTDGSEWKANAPGPA
jgi:molybdopterin synthase catalytic subunit